MENTLRLIREQIGKEANAYSQYYIFSYWFYQRGFSKIFKFLNDTAKEELEHMDKFINYYNFFTNDIFFPEIVAKQIGTESALNIFISLLNLEKNNTISINNIAKTALSEGDMTTYNFLQFFINEQFDSEDKLTKIISSLENGVPLFDLNNHIEDYLK